MPMSESSRERTASTKTRERMLACGKRIVSRTGLRGLTVRGVAAHAKVNLGTFVYHFGTREAFINELMEQWYAPIYARLLDVTVDEDSPALERLRRFLLQLATFLSDNRSFTRNVLIDAMTDEKAAISFIKSVLGRHPLLFFRLVQEAQRSGQLPEGDPKKIGIFLFGATLFPAMWLGVLIPTRLLGEQLRPLHRMEPTFSLGQIEERLDWALEGLIPAAQASGAAALKDRDMNKTARRTKSTSGARS